MEVSNAWTTQGAIDYTKRLDEYKEIVRQVFPTLPRGYANIRSISRVDALALGYFLGCYPRKVVVLDIGMLASASAFHFASQPKVLRVISIGPNPTIADEVDGNLATLGNSIDPQPLQNLRALDVARAVLAQFDDDEQQKIEFRPGTVATTEGNSQGSSLDGSEKMEIPALELEDSVSLVTFVHGVHTKEGVRSTLEATFEKNPRAAVILDDCRGSSGPFVQAGVVSFTERTQEKYHFQLFGDLGPSLATSGLGIVYPAVDDAEAKQTLVEFSELFGVRLDLLRLLRREEELIDAVSWYKKEADRYKKEADRYKKEADRYKKAADRYKKVADRLKTRNSRLNTQNPSQQQRADTLAEEAPRVPGIKELIRSKLMRT